MKNNVIMINTKTIVWIWSRQWGLRLMKVMWLQEKGNAIETQGKNDHNMKATQLEVEKCEQNTWIMQLYEDCKFSINQEQCDGFLHIRALW